MQEKIVVKSMTLIMKKTGFECQGQDIDIQQIPNLLFVPIKFDNFQVIDLHFVIIKNVLQLAPYFADPDCLKEYLEFMKILTSIKVEETTTKTYISRETVLNENGFEHKLKIVSPKQNTFFSYLETCPGRLFYHDKVFDNIQSVFTLFELLNPFLKKEVERLKKSKEINYNVMDDHSLENLFKKEEKS